MEVLMPDEVFLPGELPTDGQGSAFNPELSPLEEMTRLHAEMVTFHKRKASAIFMMSISGGILGARMAGMKVGPWGTLIAGVLGLYGYHSFTTD